MYGICAYLNSFSRFWAFIWQHGSGSESELKVKGRIRIRICIKVKGRIHGEGHHKGKMLLKLDCILCSIFSLGQALIHHLLAKMASISHSAHTWLDVRYSMFIHLYKDNNNIFRVTQIQLETYQIDFKCLLSLFWLFWPSLMVFSWNAAVHIGNSIRSGTGT
jgi:hypothetical protein